MCRILQEVKDFMSCGVRVLTQLSVDLCLQKI
jgi:hypothetical protein